MKRQKLRFNYILRRYLKVRKRWQRLKALQTNVRRQGILEKQIEKLYAQLKSLAFSLDKPVALSALSAVMITFNVEAQNFEAPVTNPFGISPVTTAWGQVSAAFVDLDNDGDFDMMTGETYGAFSYYENIGSATNPSFAAEQILPFGLTSLGNYFARPDFADIDNDGDMDLFAGHYSGNIFYFENIGTASSPNFGSIQTNPYGIAPSGITFSDVALVDIDSDGDADIISGEGYGNFIYFENSGTTSTPDFTTPPVLNPFSLTVLPVSTFGSSPDFFDVDGDGDFDLITGSANSPVGDDFFYFENIGTATTPDFDAIQSHPFGLVGLGSIEYHPSFVDIDGDGDADIFSGIYYGGNVYFYEQTCPANVTTGVACASNNGTAVANPIGGAGAYSYLWETGETTQSISGLAATSYGITVSSAGCTTTEAITIPGPSSTPISITTTPGAITCPEDTVGVVSVASSGSDLPHTYLWANGETTSTISGLGRGYHLVTVNDYCGSSVLDSVFVDSPDPMSITITSTATTMVGSSDGSATVATTGGTTPYAGYQWSNFGFNQTESGLVEGVYTVTVYDANLCTQGVALTITGPPCNLSLSVNETVGDLCLNGTGEAEGNISGGTLPYLFNWENGDTSQMTTGLSNNSTYELSVTDSVGCFVIDSVLMVNANGLDTLAATITTTNESFLGFSDGEITAMGTGGTMPYSYLWSNIETTATISGLIPGNYSLTLTDSNGCLAYAMDSIIEGPIHPCDTTVMALSFGFDDWRYFDLWVQAADGQSPYSYSWSNGASTDTIDAESTWGQVNIVTVTDGNGCTAIDSITPNWNSIKQLKEESAISIFPNPSNGRFVVQVSSNGTYDLEITNLVGQLVYQQKMIMSSINIQLNDVEAGAYLLTVRNEYAEKTEILTIEK